MYTWHSVHRNREDIDSRGVPNALEATAVGNVKQPGA